MATQPAATTFCLMVPSGTWNIAALIEAIRTHHGDAPVVAVWCGDPHRRPVLDPALDVRWCDLELAHPSGIGWGLLLAGLPDRAYEWIRTAPAVARLLQAGGGTVVALRVGSVAVLGDCSDLVSGSAPLVLVPRGSDALPADGLAPSEQDLILDGRHSTTAACCRPAAVPALLWLAERLVTSSGSIGLWLDRMAELFGGVDCASSAICVGGWGDPAERDIALIDLDALDRDEPWHFTFGSGTARSRLSTDAGLASAVQAALPQTSGVPAPISLPGGIHLDNAIAATVGHALRTWQAGEAPLPPEPFGRTNSEFLLWLEESDSWTAEIGRYWLETRLGRADLQTVFPQPQGLDAGRYREWIEQSWRLEDGRTVLLRPNPGTFQEVISDGFDPSGINVLGYLDFDQSQGHIARRLIEALEAADVAVAPINYHRSMGSRRPPSVDPPRAARFATNLVVVNADQFEFVVADHGASLLDGRHTIAYWFWELEHVPKRLARAIDFVDEIWTGSQFVADAFGRVTDKPVRCVALPIIEPQPSPRDRASMGLDAAAYLFLTTFDQFSVPERKNPFGSIDAFTRAFADGEGPMLVIKTMNGSKSWRNHERLLLAASGRRDIVVWDEHLSRPDQMALVRNVDCMVSLHRSEGLGLHCGEAMWLAKPVIATRYSGNLDFMDESVAAMIDYELVHVAHGEGIYPQEALWADPDLDQAAGWMRRLVDDRELGVDLGARARERMQQQPSMAEAGRQMATLATLRSTQI